MAKLKRPEVLKVTNGVKWFKCTGPDDWPCTKSGAPRDSFENGIYLDVGLGGKRCTGQ